MTCADGGDRFQSFKIPMRNMVVIINMLVIPRVKLIEVFVLLVIIHFLCITTSFMLWFMPVERKSTSKSGIVQVYCSFSGLL